MARRREGEPPASPLRRAGAGVSNLRAEAAAEEEEEAGGGRRKEKGDLVSWRD